MAPSSHYSYIPIDLLFLILSLLTVKTLKKLRCVCKFWKEAIDSAPFLAYHLSLQTPNPRILFHKQLPNLNYYTLLMDSQNHSLFYTTLAAPDGTIFPAKRPINLRPVATVDGVICLYDIDNKHLLLLNPSIHRRITIPLPRICLTFAKRGHYCGFWMDSFAKHFKLVIFCLQTRRIVLYSSKKKEWAQFTMSPPEKYALYCQSPQVLIDRVAYWTVKGIKRRSYVVFYDFGRDAFGKLNSPELKNTPRLSWRLNAFVSKWRDSLALVYSCECHFAPYVDCDIWVMTQNGSWTNMSNFIAIGSLSRVFCLLELKDKKMGVLGLNRPGELAIYDPEDDKCIRVVSRENKECLPVRSSGGEFSVAHEFVESLVIPDHTW